jgi:hypothetical protein
MTKAKFGCYVARWKVDRQGRTKAWDQLLTFQADSSLEDTQEAWDLAKAAAAKKWKQTTRTGWEVRELWMEPPGRVVGARATGRRPAV